MPDAVNPREDDEVPGEEKQTPEAAKENGEERANGGSGFINHLLSNFVNGDGENRTEQAEKETISAGAEGKHDKKSGGLFDHIISNLVSPLSPRSGNISTQVKAEAFDDTTASENEPGLRSEEEGGGGGGGFINNLMYNLFHPSEGEVGEGSNKKQKVEECGEDESKAEKTEGGGIIDNIVSRLPTSLPESAAPSSDEATILIHIVQD
ncbi:uncharacterized protein LOC120116051 [Hibiscus syriacus]|uniref:uncharacterized protein LOC120116051 n=1 Tax=Hibiscus syriacus TaxID=106335 RepID=UPI0019249AE7|nr:uncharacterized protein LOC120116051 [Hibiscus syriacus]